jgi:anaerobic magnesium-protoporphyrin IX monomethyl ester cyclase
MAKILLINPSWRPTYKNILGSIGVPFFPVLGLSTIAAEPKNKGHKVEILDLSYREYNPDLVYERVRNNSYDIVGFTGTTPLFAQVIELSKGIKKISKNIFTIGGGSHCSALPERSVEEADLNAVCVGEGDFVLSKIAEGMPLSKISGLVYREDSGQIIRNPAGEWIDDLDKLPLPAWDLFDIKEYLPYTSRLLGKRPPVCFFETTRGCLFQCDYCASKLTKGRGLRKKSVNRVIEEIRYMKSLGYNEFFICDDIFTTDVERTKEISRRIINEKINMAWQCQNGIRVDSGDNEMFRLMRKAGCYKVAFGFESGNDKVLKEFGKGGRASIEKAFSTVKMARKADIDVFGYFMIGLLNDTEETMRDTIEFGRKLQPDILKISTCIPFPGTKMFNELKEKNLLKVYDWECYNIYRAQDFFEHPNLKWETVEKYYKLAYKRMIYTNPGFIIRRLIKSIKRGELFYDIYYFIKLMLAGGKI